MANGVSVSSAASASARVSKSGSASAAAPESSSARTPGAAVASSASNSCRTTPNANSPSNSPPRAASTRMSSPRLRARLGQQARLPDPALPSITTSDPSPSRARSASARIAASSPSRSRNGRSRACTGVDEMPSRSSNSVSGRSSPGQRAVAERLQPLARRRGRARRARPSSPSAAPGPPPPTSADARRVLARRSRIAARRVASPVCRATRMPLPRGRAVDQVDRRRDRGARAREDAEHGAAAALDLEAAVLAERGDAPSPRAWPRAQASPRRRRDGCSGTSPFPPEALCACHLTRARG